MDNLKKQEPRKEFEIYESGDRKFKLTRFDPMEGNYIVYQIMTYILPMGVSAQLSSELGTEQQSQNLPMMSKKDFIDLEKMVLGTVYEMYGSGNTSPVIRDNGTYGVSDMTMNLSLRLLVASLKFNLSDFFGDLPFFAQQVEE